VIVVILGVNLGVIRGAILLVMNVVKENIVVVMVVIVMIVVKNKISIKAEFIFSSAFLILY